MSVVVPDKPHQPVTTGCQLFWCSIKTSNSRATTILRRSLSSIRPVRRAQSSTLLIRAIVLTFRSMTSTAPIRCPAIVLTTEVIAAVVIRVSARWFSKQSVWQETPLTGLITTTTTTTKPMCASSCMPALARHKRQQRCPKAFGHANGHCLLLTIIVTVLALLLEMVKKLTNLPFLMNSMAAATIPQQWMAWVLSVMNSAIVSDFRTSTKPTMKKITLVIMVWMNGV